MTSLDFANPGKDEQEIFFDKLRTFVVGHETTLGDMQRSLNDQWDCTLWDIRTDTATLDVSASAIHTTVADTLGPHYLHNKLFFRIVLSFSSYILEMRSLTDECQDTLLGTLSMYGDPEVGQDGVSDEAAHQGLGRLMPFLMDTWNWVERVKKVVCSIVRNLAALYQKPIGRDNYAPYLTVHFQGLWHALLDLFASVIKLEEVFYFHDVIRQGMTVYRRMLQTVVKNPEKYEADEFNVQQFGRLLNKIEQDLLDDGILMNIVSQRFDYPEGGVRVSNNGVFFAEFLHNIESITEQTSACLNTPREGQGRKKVIGICGLYALFFTIFKETLKSDPSRHRKLAQMIFDLHTKSPVVYVCGLTVFKTAQWLARRLPSAIMTVVKDPVREGMTIIKDACTKVMTETPMLTNHYTTIVTIWCSQMQSSFPVTRVHAKQHVRTMTALIQRGIGFAQEIQRLVRDIIFLHQSADLSLTLPLVDAVTHCVVLLQTIRATFHGKMGIIASMFPILIQSQVYTMQKTFYGLLGKLGESMQTMQSDEVTDQHSAVGQALALLSGPITPQSLVCLDMTLSVAFTRSDAVIPPKVTEDALVAYITITKLQRYQSLLRLATDCEFLYWQRESFYPIMMERLYERPANSQRLPYIVTAMHDCCCSIMASKHVEKASELYIDYAKYVKKCLEEAILKPMCSAIETDLRLHTHAAVLGQPFKKAEKNAKDFSRFTRLEPFRMIGERMDIASYVEYYLDVQFYNLNALHPNDWKTYEEMRTLAFERYGLQLVEGFLPGSIVDQGLDVLVITKNIHVFVANYTYNLNENFFIQRPSVTEAKHLHTLQIRHISNSIRTHGTGIMNTTVNYVYKCLLKKLSILSQFLYDDHVRSRLLKDIKYFNSIRTDQKGLYPISRAEKFCSEIRKLGVTEEGKTYLDQFRQLVAEIGNALGYMRMVRSGGLRSIADAATFVPQMDKIPHLEKCIDPTAEVEDGHGDLDEKEDEDAEPGAPTGHESSIRSARVVDEVVANMSKRLAQGSDYFRILEEAIAQKVNDETKYGHLRNFYMIVPPMCTTYVEFMVQQKELLVKKNKEGLYSDDGFALGCVFLLKLFRSHDNFDSLHWFDSVRDHYTNKQKEMKEGMAERREASKKKSKNSNDDAEGDLKTMMLTLTMAEAYLQEYELLHYAFNVCRVFFKYRVVEEEGEEEEEEEEEFDV